MVEYCNRCDRSFPHEAALDQHLANALIHNFCYRCQRDFSSPSAFQQHQQNSGAHNPCGLCDADFHDREDLEAHFDVRHFYCHACQLLVNTYEDLEDHNVESHHYCADCSKFFGAESNLRAHLRSSVHVGRTIGCPGCQNTYPTKSAMMIHLESGICISGINRHEVNEFVRCYDRDYLIMIEDADYARGDPIEDIATGAAWNGRCYECYFCPRDFGRLSSLNQHLKSPAHDQKLYHCPHCLVKFRLLSGLVQHVENESCGISRFQQTRDDVDRFTTMFTDSITYY